MDRLLVSFAGQPNTGKSSAVAYLAEKYGFDPVSPPNILRRYANDHDLPLRERRDWANVRTRLTETIGPDWLPKTILERAGRVALDGLSTRHDYDVLGLYGNVVVALVCTPELGFQRALRRRDPSKDPLDYEAYCRDLEEESNNPDPFKMSRQEIVDLTPQDYRIDASQPLDVVHGCIDAIIRPMVGP